MPNSSTIKYNIPAFEQTDTSMENNFERMQSNEIAINNNSIHGGSDQVIPQADGISNSTMQKLQTVNLKTQENASYDNTVSGGRKNRKSKKSKSKRRKSRKSKSKRRKSKKSKSRKSKKSKSKSRKSRKSKKGKN